MASSSSSSCFFTVSFFILQLQWACNGCYTSIISFGDSVSDNGILSQYASMSNLLYPCDLPPYGKTFFHKPTGRCSDGRLIIDYLAEGLGLPLLPPYNVSKDNDDVVELGQGVNYAVSGATALHWSFFEERGIYDRLSNVTLGVQMGWFKQLLSSICTDSSDCRSLIKHSLILMGEIGGNDYNDLLRKALKSIDEVKPYVPLVTDTIIYAVKELIELGARTIIVPGNLPIGCSTSYVALYDTVKEDYDNVTGCIISLNKFSEYHNEMLQTKLVQIQALHPLVNIVYADYFNAAMQLYYSPSKFGFTNGAMKACCGGGGPLNFNALIICSDASSIVCDNPDTYLTWDGVHYTDATHKWMYKGIFEGPFSTPRFDSLCPTSKLRSESQLSSSF